MEMLTTPMPITDWGWTPYSTIFAIEDIATPDSLTAVVTYRKDENPQDYLLAITNLLPSRLREMGR